MSQSDYPGQIAKLKSKIPVVVSQACKFLGQNIYEAVKCPDFANISDEHKNAIFKNSGLPENEINEIKAQLKSSDNIIIDHSPTPRQSSFISEKIKRFQAEGSDKVTKPVSPKTQIDANNFTIPLSSRLFDDSHFELNRKN